MGFSGLFLQVTSGFCLADLCLVFASALSLSWCGLGLIAGNASNRGPLNAAVAGDAGFDFVIPGVCAWAALLLYGCAVVFVPMGELRGAKRRQRMKSQAGHTLMLAYFLGLGPLGEAVRYMNALSAARRGANRDDDGGGDDSDDSDEAERKVPTAKLRRALLLHGIGVGMVQGGLRIYFKSQVTGAISAIDAATASSSADKVASMLVHPLVTHATGVLMTISMCVSFGVAVFACTLAADGGRRGSRGDGSGSHDDDDSDRNRDEARAAASNDNGGGWKEE